MARAMNCKHCGEMLGQIRRNTSPIVLPEAKSPVVAVLLEILPGLASGRLDLGTFTRAIRIADLCGCCAHGVPH